MLQDGSTVPHYCSLGNVYLKSSSKNICRPPEPPDSFTFFLPQRELHTHQPSAPHTPAFSSTHTSLQLHTHQPSAPHTPASKLSLRLLPAVVLDDDDDDGNFTKWMSSYWGHGGGDERATESKRSFRRSRQVMYERRASLPCTSQLEAMRLKHASTPPYLQQHEEVGEGEVRSHPHARRISSDEYRGRKAGGAASRISISTIPELTDTFKRILRFRNHRVPAPNDPDNMCLICHEESHRRDSQDLHCQHRFHKEVRRLEQAARPRSRSSAMVCESRKEVPFCREQEEYRLSHQRWSLR